MVSPRHLADGGHVILAAARVAPQALLNELRVHHWSPSAGRELGPRTCPAAEHTGLRRGTLAGARVTVLLRPDTRVHLGQAGSYALFSTQSWRPRVQRPPASGLASEVPLLQSQVAGGMHHARHASLVVSSQFYTCVCPAPSRVDV